MARLPPVLTSPRIAAHRELRTTSLLGYVGYAIWLGGPICVMLLAATMSVGPGRSVSLPGLGQIPETCTLHTQLGIDCPGCGLTRSFIHLAHGRAQAAWQLNPIALFMFAYVAWQIPLALISFWAAIVPSKHFIQSGGWLANLARYNQWLLVGLMLSLLLRWGARLATGGLT